MVTAALVAGFGVAGISAAAASPAAGHVEAARTSVSHPGLAAGMPMDGLSGAEAPDAVEIQPGAEATATADTPALSFARGRLKVKPVPVVTTTTTTVAVAQWVNPMPEGSVTSCFGERWGRLHAGVDLATASGTPIHAVGAGVVVRAGAAEGYGNAVLIDHGNGYLTHYGHMSVITVTVGQHVTVGQQIGNEGSTGHSTGPHLHFEVHQGTYKNPIEPTKWMHEHGVDIPGCVPLS